VVIFGLLPSSTDLAYAPGCLSGLSHAAWLRVLNAQSMGLVSQNLPLTRSIGPSSSRIVNISRLILLPVSRHWAHTPCPVHLAIYTFCRRSSTMASESWNSSESDRENGQRRDSMHVREGTPYATRAAAGATAASSFFPLGYREGFSQWVSKPSGACAHRISY